MILDKELMFSDTQVVIATGYSTDQIAQPPNAGYRLDQALQIIVKAVSGTSPTLTVELESSADGSTGWEKAIGLVIPPGYKQDALDLDGLTLKRYLRLRYVVGGTSPSFTITAGLVPGGGFSDARRIQDLADSPRIS